MAIQILWDGFYKLLRLVHALWKNNAVVQEHYYKGNLWISKKHNLNFCKVTAVLDGPKGKIKYSKCLSLVKKMIFVLSSEDSLSKLQMPLICSFVKTFSAIWFSRLRVVDAFFHNCLTCFPKPWCTMEISHSAYTLKECEETCGRAKGCTNPLTGFHRCSPSAFMPALTADKGTQIWLPGPVWPPAQQKGGEEQHCVSIAKYNEYSFSNSHTPGVMPVTFSLEIMAGMTVLLWHIDGDKNQTWIMLSSHSKELKIVQGEPFPHPPSHNWEMEWARQTEFNS